MTKLKTLKELEKDCEWKFDTFITLKQEAIKWIKYYDEDIDGMTKMEWIKHFFNITDEDLTRPKVKE